MLAQSPGNQQWIQLIVILLVAGSGVLRWVFTKLQEQAAKKKVLDQVAAGRDEELRTGRPTDPETERAQAEAQAAARRQAQIEEFRRRQQERAAQRGGRAQSPPATPKPAPARPAPKPTPKRIAAPIEALKPTTALVAELPKPTAATPQVAAARGAFARPGTPDEWRRVIVTNTILGKAPGLGEGDDPWSPVF